VSKKKFTAISIATLKARAERYEVADSESALRLLVLPSGKKSFVLRYRRPDGRPAKLTLGAFDPSVEMADEPVIGAPMTLAAARQLAAALLREKAKGRDPAALREKAKAAPSESFAAAAAVYAAHLRKANRSGDETARMVAAIAKLWGSRPLADITAHDCFDMVARCRDRGFPGIEVKHPKPNDSRARLAHSTLGAFFTWALRERKIERSPVAGLARPQAATPRDRVLDDAEIKLFWQATETAQLSPWHCAALRLLLVTGQRLNEVAMLRFVEIVGDAIVLAPARTKNKRAHTVPLSTLAREVLGGTPRVDGCGHVFSAGRAPIGGWNRAKAMLDARMRELGWTGAPWRIHDLRRTCATGLARLGTPIHVTEKVLNHASGTIRGVAAVYNRHSYAAEMRAALENWAVEVAKLTGENVVHFPERASGEAEVSPNGETTPATTAALVERLQANPRFNVAEPTGKGFIIGGAR
jgi:integrase